jgi:hypothetical protein
MLTELTNHYRILISYESEGQRLDINTISVKMKEEGMIKMCRLGKIYTMEIYYDADIPVSKTSAS